MQLFIGGASAGKRDAVNARFPGATWYCLASKQRLRECLNVISLDTTLVLHGVLEWLMALQSSNLSDDELRIQWKQDLLLFQDVEVSQNLTLVLVINDITRGVVPIEPEQRRLRDLSGWFSQEAAARAEQVWYVRHGLVQALHSASKPHH